MQKNLLIAILVFVLGLLIANTIVGWVTPSRKDKIVDEIENPKNDTIFLHQTINKDSTIVIKYKPNVGELMQNNVTKNYNTFVNDTLAPALKIATSKIIELQQVRARLEGQAKADRIEIDKYKNERAYFKEKYLTAMTIKDSLGNMKLNYAYDAQLDMVTENKPSLFGKHSQMIHITSPDKNFKINGVEHFKKNIQLPNKRFGVGPQAGYHYVPSTGKFELTFGVGAHYDLIKF